MNKQIPFAKPFIGKEEEQEVLEVLRSGTLSLGPKLELFEKMFAAYIGTKFAVAANSGTSALHICMRLIGIKEGDEVITSPFSFVASANCILYERGTVKFVDIDPKTYNLDPRLLEKAITKKTKAIIPVHIFGQPADMKPIMDLAKKNNLMVVEDACESLGATCNGKKVGSFGDLSVFAFYPNKQITTGEVGIILTDNEEYYKLAKSMINQGRSENMQWLTHDKLGFNYRLDEMSAALGVCQLRKLKTILEKRAKIAEYYNSRLKAVKGITLPYVKPGMVSSWFVYTVLINKGKDREQLIKMMKDEGIQCKAYFDSPIHLQKFYLDLGFKKGEFPVAEDISNKTLSLPFYTELTFEEIDYIVETLKKLMK